MIKQAICGEVQNEKKAKTQKSVKIVSSEAAEGNSAVFYYIPFDNIDLGIVVFETFNKKFASNTKYADSK